MKNLQKLLFFPSVLILLFSCDPLDEVGPNLCPSDDFDFTESDLKIEVISKVGSNFVSTPIASVNNIVDLNGEGLHIHARMSEIVKWELEIKAKDGSVSKTYKSESDSVGVFWYGNGDKKSLFEPGDVDIKFTIICVEDIERSVTLQNKPTFKNVHHNYGILLRDWDNNGTFPVKTLGTPDFAFGSPDGFAWIDANTFVIKYDDNDPSPMGGYSLNLYNKVSSTTWYHGATGINVSNFEDEIDKLPTMDAEEVYLNFYAKGDQTLKNTSLELSFVTGAGTFGWTTHLNWDGWKLISIKMSEFKAGTVPMVSLANASYISFNLGSQPVKGNEAQYSVDFALLTVGAPLFSE